MEKYLLALIRLLVTSISPQLREGLVGMLNDLEKKAEETPNEWDDVIVGLLKRLLIPAEKSDFV